MVSLVLVPLTIDHLHHVEALANDPAVAQFTRFPVPAPDGWVREWWYPRYEAGRLDGTREAFAAVSTDDGSFLGLALAPVIEPEAAEMELGYLVAPAARGQGVASEMLRQLTDWAFGPGGALRVALLIDAGNAASQGVARAAAYQLEGTMRSSYFKQGMRSDCQIWSRLASDPAPG